LSTALPALACSFFGGGPALAAEEDDHAQLTTATPPVSLEYDQPSEVFVKRFFEEVVTSDSLVFDRYTGPSSRLNWARDRDRLGYASLDRFNANGAKLFAAIGMDSIRTAALAVLPLGFLQGSWEGWLADFISGTIGNPEEERVHLNTVGYSATRSAWESANQNAAFQWGVRPWSISPYVYFLIRAGHFQGQPLITFEGRAGYTLLGATRIEGRLTLPLPASFRIAAGTSVDPTRLGLPDSSMPRVAVTLERIIGRRDHAPDAVFYIGFRSVINRSHASARQESLLVAGLSRPW
jgi:hypothetical protein